MQRSFLGLGQGKAQHSLAIVHCFCWIGNIVKRSMMTKFLLALSDLLKYSNKCDDG